MENQPAGYQNPPPAWHPNPPPGWHPNPAPAWPQSPPPSEAPYTESGDGQHSTDECGRCKELEIKQQILEEGQRVLQESHENLEKSCQDLKEEKEQSQRAIADLRRKCWALGIEKFKNRKRTENFQYDEAEMLYNELIREGSELGIGEAQKNEILSLHNAYVEMLIEQNKYPRAEEVGKEVWGRWEQEDNDDNRLSYRLRCRLLRQQGPEKHKVLDGWLRKTWPDQPRLQPLWTLENGDELCSVLELQGECGDHDDFEKAFFLRKGLWKERQTEQGPKHKDTVQTGIWAAQCRVKHIAALEKESDVREKIISLKKDAVKIVKEIWDLWDPEERSEADSGILTGGHMLGHFQYSQREYGEARRTLQPVWKERKTRFPQTPNDTVLTGYYLSLACFELGDLSKAKSVLEEVWSASKILPGETFEESVQAGYHLSLIYRRLGSYAMAESMSRWVWEIRKTEIGSRHPQTLEARYQMGWAILVQNRYQDAEGILREVYDAYATIQEPTRYQKDRLTCGHYLGEALAGQRGKCREAVTVMQEVFEGRRTLGSDPIEVLESGHLYGCLLWELEQSQGEVRQFPPARGIFDILWRLARETAELERSKILECDRCLVFGLSRDPRADQVLKDIWTRKKQDYGVQEPETLAFGRGLGISLMNGEKYRLAAEIFRDMRTPRNTQQNRPGVGECGHYLAVCLMEQGHYQEAENILNDIKTHPLAKALRRAARAGKHKKGPRQGSQVPKGFFALTSRERGRGAPLGPLEGDGGGVAYT